MQITLHKGISEHYTCYATLRNPGRWRGWCLGTSINVRQIISWTGVQNPITNTTWGSSLFHWLKYRTYSTSRISSLWKGFPRIFQQTFGKKRQKNGTKFHVDPTLAKTLYRIIWLLNLSFYLDIFYYNCVFRINRQPKPWRSRRHFETSWALVPVNKGILESPRLSDSS